VTQSWEYRRGNVLWRQTVDRVIIMIPSSGESFALKGTGCDLWAALHEPGSVVQLAERLSGVYGASIEQIAADIAPVIEELAGYGAVAVKGTSLSPEAKGTG